MSRSYPKKYWWVVLVVVPVVVAAIALIPRFLGGSGDNGSPIMIEDSRFSGNIVVGGTQVIFNQLGQSTSSVPDIDNLRDSISRAVNMMEGGFYEDAIALFEDIIAVAPVPAVYNNLGTLYMLENRNDQALEAFKEGIAADPTYQPLRANLARLYESEGRIQEAIDQLEHLPNSGEAEALLTRLQEETAAGLLEHEPNDDILEPNIASLATDIAGSIGAEDDIDFYRFATPPPPRDRLRIEVVNRSTELKPHVQLWGEDKGMLWDSGRSWSYGSGTPGQDRNYTFSGEARAVYYVSVSSHDGHGQYVLSLSPLEAFDSYEPNDDILAAVNIAIGGSIDANIMDEADEDYYRFQSTGGVVAVFLKNHSSELKPHVQLWGEDKGMLWDSGRSWSYGSGTPGQDRETSFEPEMGEIYYVSVASHGGSGEYTLTLVQTE